MRNLSALAAILILGLSAPLRVSSQTVLTVDRISESTQGTNAAGTSGPGVVSPNSRLLVFESTANNIVNNDNNGFKDVFLLDLSEGLTTRISQDNSGLGGDGDSWDADISFRAPNGTTAIVFTSDATNLSGFPAAALDENGVADVFFTFPNRNLFGKVSILPDGTELNGPSGEASVTLTTEPTKALVSFTSAATNVVDGDFNGKRDVYLATITAPSTADDFNYQEDLSIIPISQAADPATEPNGHSGNSQISGNGKFVVYESEATNLIVGSDTQRKQIFLFNVETGETSLVSKASNGEPGNQVSSNPSISFSGNFIAYLTQATNIIPDGRAPSGSAKQIVLYNLKENTSKRVNVTADGELGNGTTSDNVSALISPNGRFVIFSDNSSNLVPNDNNGATDLFLKDMANGSIIRTSLTSSGGEPSGNSLLPDFAGQAFNSTEALLLFASEAEDIISGDSNNSRDMFLTEASLPRLPLTRSTVLEVPADIEIDGDRATVSMEDFDGLSLNNSAALRASARRSRESVRYYVTAEREGEKGKAKDLRKLTSKKNSIALKRLKSGTYLIQYRAEIIRKNRRTGRSKVVARTAFSPVVRISNTQ
ncbi:MAG: hypothetical protein KDD42_01150 [Bdellovibrionales bacterium]|nr:hypothetical protein [Bdellovibrionales bacterium]